MTTNGARQAKLYDYEGFVKKFEPKKTTDDCYTPEAVYQVVHDWAITEYGLEDRDIVRPFWPGGDYETFDYPPDSVVIDNPPFSILASIVRHYNQTGQDYFLFAPHLTNFSTYHTHHVIVGFSITYANGAKVNTSFLTNLGEWEIRNAPDLYQHIKNIHTSKSRTNTLYHWPDELLKTTRLDPLTRAGIDFRVTSNQALQIRGLDTHDVYGGGYLLSPAKTAELAAIEPSTEKTGITITLSQREQELINKLDSNLDMQGLFPISPTAGRRTAWLPNPGNDNPAKPTVPGKPSLLTETSHPRNEC